MSAPNFGVKSSQDHGYEQVSLNNLVSFKSISSFIAFNWLYYSLYFYCLFAGRILIAVFYKYYMLMSSVIINIQAADSRHKWKILS